MKSILLFLFSFYAVITSAQVNHDSCLSAHDIGILPPGLITTICFDGSINIGFNDSTDFALANFPYPAIPNACYGYTPNVAVSAKDVWYKCQVYCDITIRTESSDTLHLSVWLGDSCSMLKPIMCLTTPGTNNVQTISSMGAHTIYLQFSGPNNLVDTRFAFCVATTGIGCLPISTSTPTPVTCLDYSVETQNSTDSLNDGSINIIVHQGNGPFTCTWSDNFTGFSRTNLSPGLYVFSITDVNGCVQMDSVVIHMMTNIENLNYVNFSISKDNNHVLVSFNYATSSEKKIVVYDFSGRIEKVINTFSNTTQFELTRGMHLLKIFDGFQWKTMKLTL